MSDPTTALKGLVVQTTGTNAGTWGSVLNTNCISPLDTMLAGVVSFSLASSNVLLSAGNVQNCTFALTGALSDNIAITPDVSVLFNGFFFIDNRTTGAFYVSVSNGVGNAMLVPQGTMRLVFSDATYGVRAVGLPPPGIFADYGGASVPSSLLATSSLVGEYLLCSGGTFSRTGVTANLFAAISTTWGSGDGTTTAGLPDLRGRARFGKDNMGGVAANRLTTAGSGIDGTTVGASGGAQSLTVAQANLPSYSLIVTDPGHTHFLFANTSTATPGISNVQQPAKSGGFGAAGDYTIGGVATPATVGLTSSGTTGITVASGGSGTALQSMNPAAVVNVLLKI